MVVPRFCNTGERVEKDGVSPSLCALRPGIYRQGVTVLERWWSNDPSERYWLEVSARGDDLGVDLNAPTVNEKGEWFWSYELLREVQDGDIVLHYDRGVQHAIVAWSWAVGTAWPDTVVWAARGTVARSLNIQPHERPGRRVSLRGPFWLATPLTLQRIREEQAGLEIVRGGRVYFPFELGSRPTRPMQGYLFKLPAAFVGLFFELQEVPRPGGGALPDLPPGAESAVPALAPGVERPDFVPKKEDVRSREARPWSRDPSEVDRALSAHARVERLVAEAATREGWTAHGYRPGDPVFDPLLERSSGDLPAVVVEVKSTTATNEEKQLRLALGQVLRYRQLLEPGEEVATLRPHRPRWLVQADSDKNCATGLDTFQPEMLTRR
jgi:hypothetical protein